jgi:hypothetical protein
LIEHPASLGREGLQSTRGPEYFPAVLLIEFGVAIDDDDIHLTALAFAAPQKTSGGSAAGPMRAHALMRSLCVDVWQATAVLVVEAVCSSPGASTCVVRRARWSSGRLK